jgi:hypothetical protein
LVKSVKSVSLSSFEKKNRRVNVEDYADLLSPNSPFGRTATVMTRGRFAHLRDRMCAVLNAIIASTITNAIDPATRPKAAHTKPQSASGTTNPTMLKELFTAAYFALPSA